MSTQNAIDFQDLMLTLPNGDYSFKMTPVIDEFGDNEGKFIISLHHIDGFQIDSKPKSYLRSAMNSLDTVIRSKLDEGSMKIEYWHLLTPLRNITDKILNLV